MQRQVLKFGQRVEIYNFLKSTGKVNGDFWEYKDEWNDQKVAEHFKASIHNVIAVRMELGRLHKSYVRVDTSLVNNHETRLQEQETMVNSHRGILTIHGQKIKELERMVDSLESFATRHGWHIPAKSLA